MRASESPDQRSADLGAATTASVELKLDPGPAPRVPGFVMVFAQDRPSARVFRVAGEPLELGRAQLLEEDSPACLISRRHVRVSARPSGLLAEDLASRNGTFVGGERINTAEVAFGQTLRIGNVLFLAVANVLSYLDWGSGVEGGVVGGPALRQALHAVAATQRAAGLPNLLLRGQSGSGKEIAANVFHRAGPRPSGPFVAVNCATIPKELAERLLFGAVRGAYSGASDAVGYVQAAHGGTLFLDEVAELPPEVQGKLLRVLEKREITRLGATRTEAVDVRVCAATWRDLRAEVAAGRFREDLYFRIGQPEVWLPPLRERVEEIPWHVEQVLLDMKSGVKPRVGFIEACAALAWPGNVRELRAEVRRAAALAMSRGADVLEAADLSPQAGRALSMVEGAGSVPPAAAFPSDEIAAALESEKGNVLGAARKLGIHRNKIRRWLERYSVGAERFK